MIHKIRTVKGPLGGKSYTTTLAGQNTIVLIGNKRLTRRQRFEHMSNQNFYGYGMPKVKATYQMAMRLYQQGNQVMHVPCMHPDGSYFYEYVEGSSYEYR